MIPSVVKLWAVWPEQVDDLSLYNASMMNKGSIDVWKNNKIIFYKSQANNNPSQQI